MRSLVKRALVAARTPAMSTRSISSSSPLLFEEVGSNKTFDGHWKRFKHRSLECSCDMTFSVFLPPGITETSKRPVLWYLSGLECTDRNFVDKAGAQNLAAKLGIVIVCPDTSPRGLGYPGEDASWDFGTGAGMYVDATQAPWSTGYRMYSYINSELPKLIAEKFPVDMSRQSISGHSMGGHGALVLALKNPGKFKSVSAFAPMVHASAVPWGIKAFTSYLGEAKESWKEYDAVELVKKYSGPPLPVLIDQGLADKFLPVQLKTSEWVAALEATPRTPIVSSVRMQPGYDHSYFFIQTFIDDHLKFHASRM